MRRSPCPRAALLLALALVVLGCGGGAPAPAPGPLLALDVRLENADQQATLLGATLLFDGKEAARFQQTRPEVAVVFSKSFAGVAAGEHEVAVRIDAQSASPSVYVSGGFATYAMKPHPLVESGGPTATGGSIRWKIAL